MLAPLSLFARESGAPPTDEHKVNQFVGTFNAYVYKLNEGIIARDIWLKVERLWERLK